MNYKKIVLSLILVSLSSFVCASYYGFPVSCKEGESPTAVAAVNNEDGIFLLPTVLKSQQSVVKQRGTTVGPKLLAPKVWKASIYPESSLTAVQVAEGLKKERDRFVDGPEIRKVVYIQTRNSLQSNNCCALVLNCFGIKQW